MILPPSLFCARICSRLEKHFSNLWVGAAGHEVFTKGSPIGLGHGVDIGPCSGYERFLAA
jgi:hypothetical protein